MRVTPKKKIVTSQVFILIVWMKQGTLNLSVFLFIGDNKIPVSTF